MLTPHRRRLEPVFDLAHEGASTPPAQVAPRDLVSHRAMHHYPSTSRTVVGTLTVLAHQHAEPLERDFHTSMCGGDRAQVFEEHVLIVWCFDGQEHDPRVHRHSR